VASCSCMERCRRLHRLIVIMSLLQPCTNGPQLSICDPQRDWRNRNDGQFRMPPRIYRKSEAVAEFHERQPSFPAGGVCAANATGIPRREARWEMHSVRKVTTWKGKRIAVRAEEGGTFEGTWRSGEW